MKVDHPRLASSEAWNPHFLCELGMHISGAAQLWVCGRLGLRCVRKHRKSMSLAKCMANPCQWWLKILYVGSFKHSNNSGPQIPWFIIIFSIKMTGVYTPFLGAGKEFRQVSNAISRPGIGMGGKISQEMPPSGGAKRWVDFWRGAIQPNLRGGKRKVGEQERNRRKRKGRGQGKNMKWSLVKATRPFSH